MKTIRFFRLTAISMSLSFLSATSYAVVSGGEVKERFNADLKQVIASKVPARTRTKLKDAATDT